MDAYPSPTAVLDALRVLARRTAQHARAPYSGRETGAALLLSDGQWVPGVRVESASYPLSIPALLAAYVTATAAGRRDVRAVVSTAPLFAGEADSFAAALDLDIETSALDGLVFGTEPLPAVGPMLDPFLDVPASDAEGLALARRAAEHAWVPESDFRVGCALVAEDGRVVLGCNVEHPDWTRGLCAERTALAVGASYAVGLARRVYLSCPSDPGGTPCGACRQLLAEYIPGVPVVMDRGDAEPATTTPEYLLPDFFSGDHLRL